MIKSRALVPIVVSIAVATLAAIAMAAFGPEWLNAKARVVASYDAGVVAMLIWHWRTVLHTPASDARTRAAAQDPGRDVMFAFVLLAVIVGLVAAFSILGRGPQDSVPQHAVAIYAVGFAAVVLGWMLIQTVFLFHYAHLYYRDRGRGNDDERGLAFPGRAEPGYMDFAYFSFVIGMTFQVSDVQVTSAGIRRLVLGQGLISFAYNTAILALVVNLVSGLLH